MSIGVHDVDLAYTAAVLRIELQGPLKCILLIRYRYVRNDILGELGSSDFDRSNRASAKYRLHQALDTY